MIEWARDGPISTEEESLSRLWSETYRLGFLWWVVIALVIEDVPDEQMSSAETTQPAVRGCAEGVSLGVK
jgi:hypothetical protein